MERSEDQGDWALFDGTLPEAGEVGLPAVMAVLSGPDASLWLGTENGIARYRARPVRGLTYETILEAYPDLCIDPVHAIRLDQRGLVWFCTGRGLFRYDGRDLWHHQDPDWKQLGRADSVYHHPTEIRPRGAWWFRRSTQEWQRFDEIDPAPLRTPEADPVTALCWTDGVMAELGVWDGSSFAAKEEVPQTDLQLRFKSAADRILPGGIPAVPRMPLKKSVWRYLQMEDLGDDFPQGPAWTTEGRFIAGPPGPDAPKVIMHKEAPGRYDIERPPPPSWYNAAVFAYEPVVRCWFSWQVEQVLTVLVRLKKRDAGDEIDPAILDRVWTGMQQVRPAGVQVRLAVEEEMVRP